MTKSMAEIKEAFGALFTAASRSEHDARMIMRTAARVKGADRPNLATACYDLAVDGWTMKQVYAACA